MGVEARNKMQKNLGTMKDRSRNSNLKAYVDGFFIVNLISKIFLNKRPI